MILQCPDIFQIIRLFLAKNKDKKFKEEGLLMVQIEFPKPTGHPQLVVTHKQAFILDAHIQDKVILSVKAPKEGSICGNPPVSVKAGHWTLRLNGSIVYCAYYDEHARGIWRAELAPKSSDTKTVISLSSGFSTNGVSAEHVFLMALGVLFVIAAVALIIVNVMEHHTKESRGGYTALAKQVDSVYSLVYNLSDEPGSKKHSQKFKEETPPNDHTHVDKDPDYWGTMGPAGLRGPKGEEGPMEPEGTKLDTLYDLLTFSLRAKFPNRFEEASTTFPHLKEFLDKFEPREGDTPRKKTLEGDGPIDGTATFKPGMELHSGESYQIGDWKILLKQCLVCIQKENGEGTRWLHGAGLEGCALTMQRDGNLVLYHPEKGALWASKDEIGKLCPKGITLTQLSGKMVCQE